MPRTRATKPTTDNDSNEPAATSSGSSSKYKLEPKMGSLPQMFILPNEATDDARIVALPNPRSGQPSRYMVCPKTGIHEFTKVSPPKSTPRSWLIETTTDSVEECEAEKASSAGIDIISSPDLFVATPIDALFLVLPSLVDGKVDKESGETKRMFLSSDDHFDKLPEDSSHLSEILRWDATRQLIESRIGSICDTVDAGDEKMFRLSESKLLRTMVAKAQRLGEGGLPPTMEERFVNKALAAPILLQKSVAKTVERQAPADSVESEVSTPQTDSAMSQSTTLTADSNSSFASQPSTAATSFVEDSQGEDSTVTALQASPEVVDLQRLRVAFDFICSRYITPSTAAQLRSSLSSQEKSGVDFSPLDKYLAKLAEIRAEAVAASSVADYSRKRMRDEEEDEIRAEKKRKMEEEKKRKASESRGVRDLKKVNTSGMKKLSAFFKAK